jgi:hypothetical protein
VTKSLSLLCAMLLLMAAAPKVPLGPVTLSARPGRELEATARKVAVSDLADGGPGALVLVGSQWLGAAGAGPALFVQVQSQRACGSAGCSTSIYLPTHTGWTKILDAISGTVVVQPEQHAGMHDLVVGKADRWVWNGHVYADTQPAPQVDLRPRHPPAKGRRTHHPVQPQ